MAFLGMRGDGDWATDQRPKNWRESILRRYPNGSAPLTAILSKMGSEKVDDPEYNWWTKSLATHEAAVTGVYSDNGLSVSYVSGGVAGDTLYVKMSAAAVTEFRVGHQVLLRDASDITVDCGAKVTGRNVNGASSYIQVSLLEADDNSSAGDLSDCDTAYIIGNLNAEGAAMPDAIAYDPTKWYNYTQIFRTPLEMTRTAMKTRLRTDEQYKEAKREALELHSIEMEKAFLFGMPSEGTGTNGKPERTTLGVIPAIRGGYTGHGGDAGKISNYVAESDYSGQSWLQGGDEWLDDMLEIIFRKGSAERLALCGSGALKAINRLVKETGQFQFTPQTKDYGLEVTTLVTAHGRVHFMTHPLMSQSSIDRYSAVVLEPKDIKFRFIDDTFFKNDDTVRKGGWTNRDGLKEEYLTEAGLEYHHPDGWAYLNGFGSENIA